MRPFFDTFFGTLFGPPKNPSKKPVLAKGTGSALQFLPQASNALSLIHSFIYSPLHYAMLRYATRLHSTLLDSTPRNRNHREVSPAKEKHPDLYSKIAAATASKQLHSAPKMAPKMSLLAPLGPHLGPRANVSMPTSQNIIIYYVLRGPLSRNIIIYYTSELSVFLIFPSGLPKWLQKGSQNGSKIDLFSELFLRCHSGLLLGHFGSQNGTKKRSQK